LQWEYVFVGSILCGGVDKGSEGRPAHPEPGSAQGHVGHQCRSAALGRHVLRCESCGSDQIAYNSWRNRHCPKCQSAAARRWLEARQSDLLPVEYYHVVFTLPAAIADIAYQNKALIYGLLFDVAAETLLSIAADPARPTSCATSTTLCCFQYRSYALRVQSALCKRLGKFDLILEPTKTKLVEFGQFAQRHASKHGRRRAETIYSSGLHAVLHAQLAG
jgi:hypothetical protein